MWLKLDLEGIAVQLRICKYQKGDDFDNWCKVDFSLISEPWLDYHKECDEILLSFEVDNLEQSLSDLLNDKLTNPKEIEFVEPDFSFILSPKKDLRTDQRFTYIQKGYEIQDIYVDWQVYFWSSGGLTSNYLSVTLYRNDIISLRNYLLLIKDEMKSNDTEILAMMNNGQLY